MFWVGRCGGLTKSFAIACMFFNDVLLHVTRTIRTMLRNCLLNAAQTVETHAAARQMHTVPHHSW